MCQDAVADSSRIWKALLSTWDVTPALSPTRVQRAFETSHFRSLACKHTRMNKLTAPWCFYCLSVWSSVHLLHTTSGSERVRCSPQADGNNLMIQMIVAACVCLNFALSFICWCVVCLAVWHMTVTVIWLWEHYTMIQQSNQHNAWQDLSFMIWLIVVLDQHSRHDWPAVSYLNSLCDPWHVSIILFISIGWWEKLKASGSGSTEQMKPMCSRCQTSWASSPSATRWTKNIQSGCQNQRMI